MNYKGNISSKAMTFTSFKAYLETVLFSDHPKKELLAEVLAIELFQTDRGVQNIFDASVGIVEKLSHYGLKVGDLKIVEPGRLMDWDFDILAMEKAGIILGGHMQAKVVGLDITKKRSVMIEYEYINKAGDRKIYSSGVEASELKDNDI